MDLDLIISNWIFARMTAKTVWMPDSTHATQKSSMANRMIAASTDPASNIFHTIRFYTISIFNSNYIMQNSCK